VNVGCRGAIIRAGALGRRLFLTDASLAIAKDHPDACMSVEEIAKLMEALL
jgi:hypothetical protein